jgi:hypothetical protein
VEWIDAFQKQVGAPFMPFVQEYWLLVVGIAGALFFWFWGGHFGRHRNRRGRLVFGDHDGPAGEGGGDSDSGGGGDGGD